MVLLWFVVAEYRHQSSQVTMFSLSHSRMVNQREPLKPFVSGFIASEERGEIYGRPVGIAEGVNGEIFITDDVGGRVLVVTSKLEN